MITKYLVIENELVSAFYSYTHESVSIVCKKTKETKIFGWPGIQGLFDVFYNTLLEETDFKAAEEFFRPNIGNVIISGNKE